MLARTLTILMIALAIASSFTAKAGGLSQDNNTVSQDSNSSSEGAWQSEKKSPSEAGPQKKVPSCLDACKADGLDADECEQECTWIVQTTVLPGHFCSR
jgi:hypothetical protein